MTGAATLRILWPVRELKKALSLRTWIGIWYLDWDEVPGVGIQYFNMGTILGLGVWYLDWVVQYPIWRYQGTTIHG